jgi:hypothetical protein
MCLELQNGAKRLGIRSRFATQKKQLHGYLIIKDKNRARSIMYILIIGKLLFSLLYIIRDEINLILK